MDLEQRKIAFVQLGMALKSLGGSPDWPGFESGLTADEFQEFQELIAQVKVFNAWFTPEYVRQALSAIGSSLNQSDMDKWLEGYDIASARSAEKKVLIMMAGNIPLVGFHDLLCVLMAGHRAIVKLSSDDRHLLPQTIKLLSKFAPELSKNITLVEGRVTDIDAVIATGSNNSSRYFEHYFGKYPHIIRKNRNSVAILSGAESRADFLALGHDLFDYFGLGCRNISKVYVPKGYNFSSFFEAIIDYSDIVNHHKYANNYDYNKAVWLLNSEQLLDNGFLLLKKEESLLSATGSLHYEEYESLEALENHLTEQASNIQCIVGQHYLPFGASQTPKLWDYADGVDTMTFLIGL